MPGSFDLDPGSVPLYADAQIWRVCRYDPEAAADERYTLIPNVRCESIQYKEGAEPSSAQFSYILDDSTPTDRDSDYPFNEDGWPTAFEVLWPIGSEESGDYVVTTGDRLVVLATIGTYSDEDGMQETPMVLWDGYAKLPQTDLGPNAQHVTFTGVGVASRCWDLPIIGRLQRNSRTTDASGSVQNIALGCRFNPDGKPNKTKDGEDWVPTQVQWPGGFTFPVFMEENLTRTPDPRAFWTLDTAVKYLLAYCNADQEFIENPDFGVLTSLLKSRRPAGGAGYYDPTNPSTYTEDVVTVRDYDATNKPWPEAVSELLGYAGFGMRFVCEDDGNGEPYNYLEVYRKDADGPTEPKEVYFPKSFNRLDESVVDIQSLRVTHDFHGVANRIVVDTKPIRFEMSFILAPGFIPSPGDGGAGSRAAWTKPVIEGNLAHRDNYRTWILDEGGDGHWNFATGTWVTDVPDFRPFWTWDEEGRPTYTARYRPGSNYLFSTDLTFKPIKSQLAISTDYTGTAGPCLWDGSGTWQPVAHGWELLKTRCGIWITANDPSSWNIGKPGASSSWPYPTGVVDAVTPLGDPSTDVPLYFLRLTTTIESDYGLGVTAERRQASPLPYEVTRVSDAHDHFRRQIVVADSAFNSGDDVEARDDRAKAQRHADQLRSAHEFPPISASMVIPGISLAFQIGDRISRINGRDVSLRANQGAGQGEKASYPFVVAITWTNSSGRQATTLQLSDRRAEVQPIGGRHG